MNTQDIGTAFKQWIPGAIIITLLIGSIYVSLQQIIRQAGNDPQVQLAQELANDLEAGANPSSFNSADKTDISKSLITYIMIADDAGKVRISNAVLGKDTPLPPAGVFEAARNREDSRVTWQPQNGVRSAVVVRHYDDGKGNKGFVLVGRSLKETEKRENDLLTESVISWIIVIAAWFLLTLWRPVFFSNKA